MMEKQKDEVSAKHPLYDDAAAERKIFQDVISGTKKLRSKEYLPQFPAESDNSYEIRRKTATLFNLTKKTVDVMTGLVFKNEITLENDVASQIKTLWENIDNAGTIGNVFARQTFEKYFEGYSLILVDAPNAKADSLESEKLLGLRPYWKLYAADCIWNWSYRINPISKAEELELIVLREENAERNGKFIFETVVRFRVFYLNEFGQVVWELWREIKNQNGETEYIAEHPPNNILEKPSQIPVAVVGKLGNKPRLMDIAYKNIEHFQTYSDYKNSIHKTCVPMLKIIGDTVENAATKIVGADIAWAIENPQGDVGFAEVQGESIPNVRQSLLDCREDISLMGLSLLADKTAKADLTATEALLNNIGETAELRVMAQSLKDALELALGHTAEYLGLNREQGGSITLGTAWKDENAEDDLSAPIEPPKDAEKMEMVN